MRLLVVLSTVACLASVATGQTSIDLRTQAKDVDFSGGINTKPSKTGTFLPATCSAGETFFNLNAAAGQNLYLCTALNTWTVVNGQGGGASLPFVTAATTTTVTITNGTSSAFGCNGINTAVAAGSSTIVPLAGSATEVLWIGVSCIDFRLKLIAPTNTFTCTPAGFSGCDTISGNTFTDGIIPLASVTMTQNGTSFTFGAVSDLRAPFQDDPPAAGTGIIYTKSGSTRTFAVDTTMVPLLTSYGDYIEITAPGAPATGRERIYAKAGSGFCAKDSSGVERCTGGSGSSPASTTETIQLPTSGCDYTGVGRSLWFIPNTNGATGACFTNGASGLVYASGANAIATAHFTVPQGWTNGAVTLVFAYFANTGASNTLSVRTSCLAAGADMTNPSWNSAQSVTATSVTGMNYVTLSNPAMTGCSAGLLELMEVTRTDANNNVITLANAEVRIVRAL